MLQLKLAKNMMENEEGMNHLMVHVSPEENKSKNEKPVAFFLVIDTSGSMNDYVGEHPKWGVHDSLFNHDPLVNDLPFFTNNPKPRRATQEFNRKLDFVKQASEKLVDTMKDNDMLGIVSFSNIASLEYELTTLTKENRRNVKQCIRSLYTSGATNVSDGLLTAFKQIPEELKETHHIKLLLLSDGEANNGIRDVDGISSLASDFQKQGVSISTIGVGNDYNSFFMESIATASGGMFYHLKELSSLNDIFTKELEELTHLTTKDVYITIQTPKGVHVSTNLNGFPEREQHKIFLGNLFYEQFLISEIYIDEKTTPRSDKITVSMEYFDSLGNKKTIESTIPLLIIEEEKMEEVVIDPEVTQKVKELLEASTKKNALRSYESGDTRGIQTNLDDSIGKLSQMQNAYNLDVSFLSDEMENLKTSMLSNQIDRAQAKSMYSDSYDATRNSKK